MRARTEGAALVAIGCLPFAVGALVPTDGVPLWPPCAFRTVTGLPCPMCGGTRAFAFAARGDASFTSYNAFWVAVAVVAILAGLFVLLSRRQFVAALTRTPWRTVLTLALLGSAGWAYAFAERATIAPQ
jgi:hypothetical protein